ncbi:hypothetical protein EDC94DRAFT_648245 [Helicostylum pulchrum]|nr:hypothetical protein EDC94DRAFT_648245 [Helicostylum pulchrum]
MVTPYCKFIPGETRLQAIKLELERGGLSPSNYYNADGIIIDKNCYQPLRFKNRYNNPEVSGFVIIIKKGHSLNYKLAKKWYELVVENGNLKGIADPGKMCRYGYGVKIDYKMALNLYRKAGDYGEALNSIGLLHQCGLGVAQSHSTGIYYLEKATEMDCCDAFNSLGDIYKYGYRRDVDLETAFKKKDDGGLFNLELMYMEDSGTETNKDLALYWLRRADLFGNRKAKKYIDEIGMGLTTELAITDVTQKLNYQLQI